jgi:hypothetical protein
MTIPKIRIATRTKVDDHKKRAGDSRDKKDKKDKGKATRLLSSPSAGSIKQL